MASEASPPGEQVKRSSRRQQKKTGEVEDRTWAGHRALQAGRPQDALRYFKQALQAATQVSQVRFHCWPIGWWCVAVCSPLVM